MSYCVLTASQSQTVTVNITTSREHIPVVITFYNSKLNVANTVAHIKLCIIYNGSS